MDNLEKYSKTELLKIGNDIKAEHEKLKQEIIVDIDEMTKLEIGINIKLINLELNEKNYVEIVEKLGE